MSSVKQPEYIRKVINMWMGKEKKEQEDLQLILLCAIALDDQETTRKVCDMGASPIINADPKHIWLLQQYGYMCD